MQLEAIAGVGADRQIAPLRLSGGRGEFPDARGQTVHPLADPPGERRLDRGRVTGELDAGGDAGQRWGWSGRLSRAAIGAHAAFARQGAVAHVRPRVQPGARGPRGLRAGSGIEQGFGRTVGDALDGDRRLHDRVGSLLAHGIRPEHRPADRPALAARPDHLSVQRAIFFARIRLSEHVAVLERRRRPLRPADDACFVARRGCQHDVREQRCDAAGDQRRVGALVPRRAVPAAGEHEARPISGDRTADERAAVAGGVEARRRRRVRQRGVGEEGRTGGDAFDLTRPSGGGPPRRQRNRKPGSVDIDRHQPGGHVHVIPGGDAGKKKRRAAAVGRCDVDAVQAERRLRPRAAVRADARRGAGGEPAGVDAVGDHFGHDGIEQREQIAAARQIAERIDGQRAAQRRTLDAVGRRLRRGGRGRNRAKERQRDSPPSS